MPEFILPEEADRCPYCGGVLRGPPDCCARMAAEHEAASRQEWEEAAGCFDLEQRALAAAFARE